MSIRRCNHFDICDTPAGVKTVHANTNRYIHISSCDSLEASLASGVFLRQDDAILEVKHDSICFGLFRRLSTRLLVPRNK